MKKWLPVLLFLAVSAGCSSMKAHIDYDRDADFDSFKTFMWHATAETSMEDTSQLMHRRVVDAFSNKLVSGGLRKVTSDPDLMVTYHTDERQEVSVDTNNFGYGYGAGWGWDPYWGGGMGMGTSTTTVREYTRGSLIFDIWDPRKKQLIWRGTVEDIVPEDPQKGAEKIQKAVDKLAEEWQKKRAKMGS